MSGNFAASFLPVKKPSTAQSLTGLALAGGLVLLAARSGINASPSNGTLKTKLWWKLQKKPAFMPPNKAFATAWPVLWGLSSLSFLRIWRSPSSTDRTGAIASYMVHGGLNAAWSPLFFKQHQQTNALATVIGDLAATVAFARSAFKIDRLAGALVTPLVAWLGFASVLNFEMVRRNR